MRLVPVVAIGLLACGAACGGGDDVSCGDGTVEQDGTCVPAAEVCGDGTVLQGGQCVPATDGDAPSVASIDPAIDLVGGGASFTITGTGFTAAGAGDTTVAFGGVAALIEVVSDTEITGTVPRGTAPVVEVTVTNGRGSDGVEFRYAGLYAADGKAGIAGALYLLDPRDATAIAIGAIESAGAVGHGVTGLAFAADGTLFATEATSGGDLGPSRLLTIDPATAAATIVGPLTDSADDAINHGSVPDITFAGETLVGWTERTDDAVTIDPATGVVSVLGDSGVASAGDGLATLDGVVIGAVEDARSAFYSIDPGTGAVTELGTLTSDPELALEVCAMTTYAGALYAILCPNVGAAVSGSVLATIDAATGALAVLGAAPPGIDALASDDPTGTTARGFTPPTTSDPALLAALASAPACDAERAALRSRVAEHRGLVPVRGKRAGLRGLPLTAALERTRPAGVEVVPCGGAPLAIAAAELGDYALVENQRGHLKLVERATGRRVAADVVELR